MGKSAGSSWNLELKEAVEIGGTSERFFKSVQDTNTKKKGGIRGNNKKGCVLNITCHGDGFRRARDRHALKEDVPASEYVEGNIQDGFAVTVGSLKESTSEAITRYYYAKLKRSLISL